MLGIHSPLQILHLCFLISISKNQHFFYEYRQQIKVIVILLFVILSFKEIVYFLIVFQFLSCAFKNIGRRNPWHKKGKEFLSDGEKKNALYEWR